MIPQTKESIYWEALQFAQGAYMRSPTEKNKQRAKICLAQWADAYGEFLNGNIQQITVN